MRVSTLRPGLLVGLKTSVTGNISYAKRDIEADHDTEDGGRRAKWETERTIADPDEHEKAVKARGAARTLITKLCASSAFGLLCPEAKRDELDAAVQAARAVADAFNATARLTEVSVHVIIGRIADDDVEAVRAINGEVRDLLETMATGIKKLDSDAIREAATKARQLGQMLSPSASDKVNRAIETARDAARKIAKTGESASAEVQAAQLRIIRTARSAFLDLDEAKEVARPVDTLGRSVDFMPAEMVEASAASSPAVRAIDL